MSTFKEKILKVPEYGLKGIIDYIQYGVLRIESRKVHYFIKDLEDFSVDKTRDYSDLTIIELTENYLREHGDPDVFTDNKLNRIRSRFSPDSGYKGFGVIDDNELVYTIWVSFKELDMSVKNPTLTLMPDEALLDDAYCIPRARGKGIHYKMFLFLMDYIISKGKKRAVVLVQDGNTPALRVPLKLGFKEVTTFRIWYIRGREFVTLRKGI